MPQPLIFDPDASAAATSRWYRILRVLFACLSMLGTIVTLWMDDHGGTISGEFGPTEAVLRAVVFSLPIGASVESHFKAARYRVAPDEHVVGRARYLQFLPRFWWMAAPLWPSLLLALAAVGSAALSFLTRGQVTPLSHGSAFGTYFCILLVSLFFSAVLLTQQETRVDNEGLRFGVGSFIEWKNVSRMVETPIGIEIFHRHAARFPVVRLALLDDEQRRMLLEKIAPFNIVLEKGAPTDATPILLRGSLAGAALLLGGLAAWLIYNVDARWVIVITFMLGFLAMQQIDNWRGLSKVTRIKPPVDKASLKLKPGQTLPEPVLAPPIPLVPEDTSRR